MTFTLSGTTITQAGTDTDLSGLSGIAGVTVITSGSGELERSIYHLGDVDLSIEGTLYIDPYKEEIISGGAGGNDNGVSVRNGGTLDINGSMTINGITHYTQRRWYTANVPQTSSNKTAIRVESGSTLNWTGGEALVAKVVKFLSGSTVNIKNAVIDSYNVDSTGATTAQEQQMQLESSGVSIDGLILKRGFMKFVAIPALLQGFQPQHCFNANAFSGGTPNVDVPINGYNTDGSSSKDVGLWAGARPVFSNAVNGTDIKVGPNANGGNTNDYGFVSVRQSFNPLIVAGSGPSSEGAKIYVSDYDNGNREEYTQEGGGIINSDQDFIYEGVINSSNELDTALNIWTGFVVVNTGTANTGINTGATAWDYRGKNNDTTDVFDVFVASYGHALTSYSASMKGAGDVKAGTSIFLDTSITEADKTIVDAYTTLDSAQQFYDRAKSYLVDNYTGETATIINRSGDTIDAGSYNVTVLQTGDAFLFDGTTITINSALFTGNVITTGTVTDSGSAITGIVTDINGTTSPSVMNLSTVGRWAIYNNLGVFVESGTGNKTYNHTRGSDTGTWTIVSHRLGYQAQKFSWVADNGTTINLLYSGSQVIRPEGGASYSGNPTAGITTTTSGDKILTTIGNEKVSSQIVIDSIQDYLNTDAGLDWLHTYEDFIPPTWGELSGISFYINVEGFVYDSSAGTTPESGVNALLISSASHANIITTNGGTIFASAGSEDIVLSQTQMHTYLDNYLNKDDWKADLTGIVTSISQKKNYVFVDTEALVNGDGTEGNPYDNFDNAKTLADTIGAKTIYVSGDATINVNLKNYNIIGNSSRATIDLNGQNVDGSHFENIIITGTASEPSNPKGFRADNCTLDGVSGLQGIYIDCLIKGTLTPADNAEINLDDCNSGIAGLGRPVIDVTGKVGVKLAVRKYSGGLTLTGSTDSGNEVTISSTEMKLTLDATNTDGTISVRGQGQLTDDSTATVDTVAWLEIPSIGGVPEIVS